MTMKDTVQSPNPNIFYFYKMDKTDKFNSVAGNGAKIIVILDSNNKTNGSSLQLVFNFLEIWNVDGELHLYW